MGNECCSSRHKIKQSDFSEKERENLQELYNTLTQDKSGYLKIKRNIYLKEMGIMN